MAIDKDPYLVLGVAPGATHDEIRAAYRTLARRLHPDVASSAVASAEMAAVNQAWATLSDPAKRRAHDDRVAAGARDQSASAPHREAPHPEAPLPPLPPSRFPWRFLLFLAAVGSVAVLTAHARSTPPAPDIPDQLLTPGSCVDIAEMSMVVEVRCDGPHDGVVRQFLAIDRTCPQDTDSFRDRQGMGRACVDLVEVGEPVGSG